jgi:hypothetical protein
VDPVLDALVYRPYLQSKHDKDTRALLPLRCSLATGQIHNVVATAGLHLSGFEGGSAVRATSETRMPSPGEFGHGHVQLRLHVGITWQREEGRWHRKENVCVLMTIVDDGVAETHVVTHASTCVQVARDEAAVFADVACMPALCNWGWDDDETDDEQPCEEARATALCMMMPSMCNWGDVTDEDEVLHE